MINTEKQYVEKAVEIFKETSKPFVKASLKGDYPTFINAINQLCLKQIDLEAKKDGEPSRTKWQQVRETYLTVYGNTGLEENLGGKERNQEEGQEEDGHGRKERTRQTSTSF